MRYIGAPKFLVRRPERMESYSEFPPYAISANMGTGFAVALTYQRKAEVFNFREPFLVSMAAIFPASGYSETAIASPQISCVANHIGIIGER